MVIDALFSLITNNSFRMKIQSFFQVLFLSFLLAYTSSCSNDDSADLVAEVDISGSWELQSFTLETILQENVSNPISTVTTILESSEPSVQISFTTNPNEIVSSGSYDMTTTTILTGNVQDENISKVENIDASTLLTGEWTQNNNESVVVRFLGTVEPSDNPNVTYKFLRISNNLIEIESSIEIIELFEGTEFRANRTFNLVMVR